MLKLRLGPNDLDLDPRPPDSEDCPQKGKPVTCESWARLMKRAKALLPVQAWFETQLHLFSSPGSLDEVLNLSQSSFLSPQQEATVNLPVGVWRGVLSGIHKIVYVNSLAPNRCSAVVNFQALTSDPRIVLMNKCISSPN